MSRIIKRDAYRAAGDEHLKAAFHSLREAIYSYKESYLYDDKNLGLEMFILAIDNANTLLFNMFERMKYKG